MGWGRDEELEYEEDAGDGFWTMQSGEVIHITKMTPRHLRNTIRHCRTLAQTASCTSDEDYWLEWADILTDELSDRKPTVVLESARAPKQVRGSKVAMICHCGTSYQARQADLDRGWAQSCSKVCAARRRESLKK